MGHESRFIALEEDALCPTDNGGERRGIDAFGGQSLDETPVESFLPDKLSVSRDANTRSVLETGENLCHDAIFKDLHHDVGAIDGDRALDAKDLDEFDRDALIIVGNDLEAEIVLLRVGEGHALCFLLRDDGIAAAFDGFPVDYGAAKVRVCEMCLFNHND